MWRFATTQWYNIEWRCVPTRNIIKVAIAPILNKIIILYGDLCTYKKNVYIALNSGMDWLAWVAVLNNNRVADAVACDSALISILLYNSQYN